MEDDVEVELELEKQLALAHELFPTWPKVHIGKMFNFVLSVDHFSVWSAPQLVAAEWGTNWHKL